jgi:hypothetical protein
LALRILTQINYSAGENPDGDSGLHFISTLLLSLVRMDRDLHCYVLVPTKHEVVWGEALSHPRITPVAIDLVPRLHGGDFHFDPAQLIRKFDLRRFDVDVLFLNQPETAPAFLQFFNRQTFHNVPAVSYVHWFDTRRPSTPKQMLHRPALLGALSGMMVSTLVGCNSTYGRDLIIKQATQWFNEDAMASLSQRFRILPPAVDVEEILRGRAAKRRRRSKQILVNHRLLKYTGVRTLLTDTLPSLWARRQDFSVLITNPTRVRLPRTLTNVPWLRVKTLERSEYIKSLWESDIVIAPHRNAHWSMSTLEAISAECIPLMNRESFFGEMIEPLMRSMSVREKEYIEERWFFYRGSIISQLSALLDNLEKERSLIKKVAKNARSIYESNRLAHIWRQVFREAESEIPIIGESNPSMCKIIEMLEREPMVTKREILRRLRWAPKQRALSWTAFRKQLKSIAVDDSSRPDATFALPR